MRSKSEEITQPHREKEPIQSKSSEIVDEESLLEQTNNFAETLSFHNNELQRHVSSTSKQKKPICAVQDFPPSFEPNCHR